MGVGRGGGGMGGTDTEWESAHKLNSAEESSPAAPAGTPTPSLTVTSPESTNELSQTFNETELTVIGTGIRRSGGVPDS